MKKGTTFYVEGSHILSVRSDTSVAARQKAIDFFKTELMRSMRTLTRHAAKPVRAAIANVRPSSD
jgi:hypothetical protein